MYLMKKLLLVALLSGIFANISAQNTKFTLTQCVDYALKNNLNIKQSELSIALADADYTQSRYSVLPSLNASGGQQYNFGRSIDPLTNQFANQTITSTNFGLNSQVLLFGGFQRINQIRQNKYNLATATNNLEKLKNDISLNVVTAFLQLLYNQENENYTKIQLESSNLQLKRVNRNVEVGNSTTGDMLDIKAQYSRDELNYINAQNQVITSKLTLQQLLEIPISEAFSIDTSAVIPFGNYTQSYTSYEIYNTAAEFLPEIKAADSRLKAAETNLNIARSGYYPRVSLGGSYSTGYSSGRQQLIGIQPNGFQVVGFTQNTQDTVLSPDFKAITKTTPFNQQISENISQSISLSVSLPIFNGFSTRTNVKKAKINIENENLNVKITQNNLNKTITQALADYNAAQKQYISAKNNLEALSQSNTNALRKYEVGNTSYIDYTLSQLNFTKGRSDFLQAKYNLIFKAKVIDYYLGKPLTF